MLEYRLKSHKYNENEKRIQETCKKIKITIITLNTEIIRSRHKDII